MSECKKTGQLGKALTSLGAVVVPYCATRRQPSGYPDRLVWHTKWSGWLEFKDIKTRLTPLQKHRITELNKRKPGSAYVVRFGSSWSEGQVETVDGEVLSEWYSAEELLEDLKELSFP